MRGNEVDENGRYLMGRKGFFGEVMRFYDRYLRRVRPAEADPPLAVQSSDGRWRSERSWPPADFRPLVADLRPGMYIDHDGTAIGHAPTGQPVTVKTGNIRLPLLRCARTRYIHGRRSVKLQDYRESAPFEVSADTIDGGTDRDFPIPPAPAGCG